MIAIDDIAKNGQYTIKEVAEILHVHRNTVRRYVVSGALRCRYRRGNSRPFFMGSDLIMFCKALF